MNLFRLFICILYLGFAPLAALNFFNATDGAVLLSFTGHEHDQIIAPQSTAFININFAVVNNLIKFSATDLSSLGAKKQSLLIVSGHGNKAAALDHYGLHERSATAWCPPLLTRDGRGWPFIVAHNDKECIVITAPEVTWAMPSAPAGSKSPLYEKDAPTPYLPPLAKHYCCSKTIYRFNLHHDPKTIEAFAQRGKSRTLARVHPTLSIKADKLLLDVDRSTSPGTASDASSVGMTPPSSARDRSDTA